MNRSSMRNAALHYATCWGWPVLPGAALDPASATARQSEQVPAVCSCPDLECPVPGAHPFDPVLLAASTDPRMVSWWWTNRPTAPLLLATGGRGPSALSLPAIAGARALAEFDRIGERVGPVVATPTRFTLLVEPYALAELGEKLYAQDWVPSSLRFHGDGGYIPLPPSHIGAGRVRWEREPAAAGATAGDGRSGRAAARRAKRGALPQEAPWLPRMERLLDVLVEASATAPDSGTSLTF